MKKVIYWVIALAVIAGVLYGIYYFVQFKKVQETAARLLSNPSTRAELQQRAVRNKSTLQKEAENMAARIA
jgi:hypothetical protein